MLGGSLGSQKIPLCSTYQVYRKHAIGGHASYGSINHNTKPCIAAHDMYLIRESVGA